MNTRSIVWNESDLGPRRSIISAVSLRMGHTDDVPLQVRILNKIPQYCNIPRRSFEAIVTRLLASVKASLSTERIGT